MSSIYLSLIHIKGIPGENSRFFPSHVVGVINVPTNGVVVYLTRFYKT